MAIKIKVGKSFMDKSDVEHKEAYSVIDYVAIDKYSLYCKFKVRTFTNKAARENKANPITVVEHCCSGDEFETFFGVKNVKNLHKLCYEYAAQMTKTIIVDEVESEELVYNDWESDE